MRKAALALIVGFVLLMLIGLLLTQSLTVMQRLARVSNVTGIVQLHRKGEQAFGPLGDIELVKAGDILSTGPAGSLTLNWIDGTKIQMEPNTTLTVLKCQIARGTEYSQFKLDVGKIWIRILKVLSQQSKFEISTPTATAGVRGTIFAVTVAPDGATEISVYEGSVTVDTATGPLQVSASTIVHLSASQAPAQVTSFSPQDQQSWKRQLPALGPYLQIAQPAMNQTTFTGDTITVAGRCERKAKLVINQQPVTLRPNGEFSVELAVPPDQQSLTIEAVATDREDYTTTVLRRLSQATGETE